MAVLHSLAQRPQNPMLTDAINTLNRLGHVTQIDHAGNGYLELDGERVYLRIQDRTLVAIAGGAVIPWSLFRRTLRPVPKISYPPRGFEKDGTPNWADGPDIVPPRKDQRHAGGSF